jgi:vitamin B12 transporter
MFSSVEARADAAVVVNLAANVEVSDRVALFGRIDNLFDEDYEEVYGYGTAGVSGYGGVRVSL